MRIIIPLILIALLLPFATSSDQPTREWLIPPDPRMGVVLAGAANAADEPSTRDRTPHRWSSAATQPAIKLLSRADARPDSCHRRLQLTCRR